MRQRAYIFLLRNIPASLWLIGITGVLLGCSNSQKGGDHVPELQTYAVQSLPEAAFSDGLKAKEVSAQYFRSFVHIAESYQICLPTNAFTATEISSLETSLKTQAATINQSGLEVVINRALATVSKYNPQRAKFSSRIDFRITDGSEGGCHAVVQRAGASEFPFKEAPFQTERFGLFYVGQLRVSDQRTNRIPVIYIQKDLSTDSQDLALKQSLGAFLGLGISNDAQSTLNTAGTNPSLVRSYLLENSVGETNINDDAAILYGFALMYQDVLKPEDLASFQHYGDHIAPGAVEEDKDIALPTGSVPIAFTATPGSRYLSGVRQVTAGIQWCVQNASGATVSDDWWSNYSDFTTVASEPRTDAGLFYQLHMKADVFAPVMQRVTSGCNLLVVIKNHTQYPFATKSFNGLYAHEQQIRGSDGVVFTIPVIYLNATNLTLDPQNAANSQGRYVGDVLQHEFAHYFGLKHSTSPSSIFAPSGYNRSWDLVGGDSDLFQSFIVRWQRLTGL